MERAAESVFLIVLQQKDLGVGAAWIMATMFFIWTTLKRTVHSSTQVLSATPKQKFMVLLLGSAALLVSLKIISCTNTMTFLPTSSSKHRCQHNFVSSRAQHAKQV